MKGHHHLTAHKDHENVNRKLKWSSEHSRTPKKIVRKSLDSVLTTVSEDVPIESAKDLIDTSSSCEVLDENQLNGSPESSVNSLSAAAAVSPSVASTPSDLSGLNSTICSDASSIASDFSPLPSTITYNMVQANNAELNHNTADSGHTMTRESLKAEIFARKFRQAGSQSFKPNDMILLSENVMGVLMTAVIKDLNNLPEKNDRFTAIVENKVYIVLKKVFSAILTSMLVIIVVGVFVFSAGDGGSYHGLLPT
ncbi:hypothetical protein ACET3Z_024436 [Daucus carota]